MPDQTEDGHFSSDIQRFGPLDQTRFTFNGRVWRPDQITKTLEPFLSRERVERIDAVIAGRTYTVATVVEGLINMGNVSAVMRSAEALGCQSFHIITGEMPFKNSPRTTQGADKWLDLYYWDTPLDCVACLKENGYTVVVTHLDEQAVPISEIDFTQKTALIFGNESEGVTHGMRSLADKHCIIPMVGFVESFNISVAAAVSLYHAYRDRIIRQGFHGDLSEEQRQVLRAVYFLRSVNKSASILGQIAL